MEFGKTVLRHVYIDVTVKDFNLEEVYLYSVDYKNDKSFRTSEVSFTEPLPSETTDDDGNVIVIPAEEVDLRELFFEKLSEYRSDCIKTKFFAVDSREVLLYLIEPLKTSNPKAKRVLNEIKDECLPGEWITDVMSMLRTIPMTDFDECPEMSAAIRKRFKEKYHDVAQYVKKEKPNHIFVKYENPLSGGELSFCVTDSYLNVTENIVLHGQIDNDIMVSKACELINRYPGADVIINKTSVRLYKLFKRCLEYLNENPFPVIFSMESMLYAIGKAGLPTNYETYRDYIKNAEDLRFGRLSDDSVYSYHTFRLPISYNSDSAWDKNFKNNSMWQMTGEGGSEYSLIYDKNDGKTTDVYGKISAIKNNEKFILKVSRIKVKKYYECYAVITIEAENRFYPGARDAERINELCGELWCSKGILDKYPDKLEVQLRNGQKIYSVNAGTRDDANTTPWIALLLDIGRKKPNAKRNKFVAASLSDRMFALSNNGNSIASYMSNEEVINKALVKSEFLLQLEMYLAETIEPKGSVGFGGLTRYQRREVKCISGALAYMVCSYCYSEEQGEYADVYKYVNKVRHIKETEDRLSRKLDLLYE